MYFLAVNTKYISSNVLKILVISRVFSIHEMKYFWYLPKKVNFLFIYFFFCLGELNENEPHQNQLIS